MALSKPLKIEASIKRSVASEKLTSPKDEITLTLMSSEQIDFTKWITSILVEINEI